MENLPETPVAVASVPRQSIVSWVPAAANATGTGVGYAEASQALGISGAQTASWGGETVDATSVLARYTLLGDATLDG